jgi:pimeloyl-ACP methyl ester carboxylesterase
VLEKQYLNTPRRKIAYYRLGDPSRRKLLLIHGNVSSAAFFFPTMLQLAEHYDVAAPDLNGFGDTQASPVKAPTALTDWAEDIDAFAQSLGFDRFALLGWSLGGGVAMRYVQLHPEKTTHLILLSPMSPYGFGGTKGEDGQMYDRNGWGAPGGFANPAFLAKLAEKDEGDDQFAARSVLEKSLFAKGWPMEKQWQDLFVKELLKMQLGEDYYPGNYIPQAEFPYVLPGEKGISNALAPQYANVSGIRDINPKPPILWIRGDADSLVSDNSFSDLAVLGQMGIVPGYPGAEVFPPQPMVAQTRKVLEQYKENGGAYTETVFPGCSHASHLEEPDKFVAALTEFIA